MLELAEGPALPVPRMGRYANIPILLLPEERIDTLIVLVQVLRALGSCLCLIRDISQMTPIDNMDALPFTLLIELLGQNLGLFHAEDIQIVAYAKIGIVD